MRVLHVIDSVDEARGGTTRAVQDLGEALSLRGHDVTIAAVGRATRRHTRRCGTTVREFAPGVVARYSWSPAMLRWLRGNVHAFDLVEVHGVFHFPACYAASLCVRRQRPFLVRPHGSLDPFDLTKHALVKQVFGPLVVRRILDAAIAVVCTTPQESALLQAYGSGVPRHWTYLPVSARPTGPQGQGRGRWGLPDSALVLLFLGRLNYKKGLERLLHALAELPADVHLLLGGAGDDDYLQSLRVLADRHRVSHRITWAGHVDASAKADAWDAGDVFVLNSDNENFGIAVVEAAEQGLPLALSPNVYIHEPFVAAGAALAPEATTPALTEALNRIVGDHTLRHEMGQAARACASGPFSFRAASDAYEQLLRELLPHAGPGMPPGSPSTPGEPEVQSN